MKILLMGLTASGKSLHSKRIAGHFGLNHYCGSAELLKYIGFDDSTANHWWFTRRGDEVERIRDQVDADIVIDKKLLDVAAREKNFILESWTVSFLYKGSDAIRIYLNPSLDARVRMAKHSKKDRSLGEAEIRKGIERKDELSRSRFNALYGIDIYDTSGFDLVIDNSLLTSEQTGLILNEYIRFASNGLCAW